MEDTARRRVRSFNRTVTQRIGALHDEYLARGRPLGASRVLWEIGDDGTDVRALRVRLDLDSGYLSRLVRSLEREGLAAVEPGSPDKRVRTVRLTDAGRAERELLDERSDELASSLLAPLSGAQQTRLVEAMGVVERLLTAGLVAVDTPPALPRGSASSRTSPSSTPASTRASIPPRASPPTPTSSPNPLAFSWSPGFATKPSAVERSSSTVRSPARSSACGSPPRLGASASRGAS